MLEGYPKEIMRKMGHPSPSSFGSEDEQHLSGILCKNSGRRAMVLRDNVADPAVMHVWIKNVDYDRILPRCSETEDNTIVANVRLTAAASECLHHIAHLRIMVDPAYRQQRLGTWMLLDTIRLASSVGIEKLVAEFIAELKTLSMNAARKLDFFEEAVLKDYVKDSQGRYRDLIIMVKTLHRDWSDF
jgi:L-amino acid N-acyltransferase YncA